MVGGGLLIWIAIKLLADEDDETAVLKEADRLWHAVRTVAVADAVMSLDNVIAIAAVAQGSTVLLVIGLAISIPLIVGGAALVMAVLARLPILVWAGAALLGWIAGEMLISDPWLIRRLGKDVVHRLEIPAAIVCTTLVVGLGYTLSRRSAEQEI
jgi:YjbE family integral membrane protein